MKKRLLELMLVFGAAVHAQQFVEVDRNVLSRAVQRKYFAAIESGGKPQEMMRRAAAALSAREPLQSRRLLLQSLAEWKGLQWSEAHDAASVYSFRIGETVVEPRSNIHAVVERIDPAAPAEGVRLRAQIRVLNGAGETLFTGRERPIEEMTESETIASAPAAEGRYSVAISIRDGGSGAVLAEGRNDVWVVANLRSRLLALAQGARSAVMRTSSPGELVWLNTILGITEHYLTARSAAIRSGWQFSSPLVQTLAPQAVVEPLDPMADIAWAEQALAGILKGRSPAGEGGLWTPLRAPGTDDQGLDLARAWWPKGKAEGIVVLMGDALTHQRSWDDLRPAGAFVCIVPAFLRGFAWEGVEGLVAAAAKAAGLENGPLYLFVHGVGARDGLRQAEKEPSRFAAVAALAPLSDQPLTSVPKTFPAYLLLEAAKDGLIPANSLQRVGLTLARRLEKFEYAVLPGVDHDGARGPGLEKSLEFFKAISTGTWKRPQ